MTIIKIKPIRVTGQCRANLTLNDEVQIRGVNVENPGQNRMCYNAFSHFAPTIATLQRGKQFSAVMTCPDCILQEQNGACVDFLLGHADKWKLCEAMAEYRQLCEHCLEPELARRLRTAATQNQQCGEFAAATNKMEAAVTIMREAVFAY